MPCRKTGLCTSIWMKSPLHLLLLSCLCPLISGYSKRDRVHDLMSRYPLIDGHNDLALQLRILHNNCLSQINLHNVSKTATDISRLQRGHVQAQMFSIYVMCGAQEKDAVRLTLEQIDVVRRMCTEYQEFELVTSAQELKDSHMRNRIACLMSIEGGHSIDSSLPALRMFYQLGVRSMALTHTCNTPWAESSSHLYNVYQRQNNSLTHFGKVVVEEMNRLGMIVDLSHSSWDTAAAVLKHSKAPVIFSHSSSYSVCKHRRNVPDWLLHELRKNRGLIMVNLCNKFISCADEGNISAVADHFDHIKKVIGAESIGIGGDFDGAIQFGAMEIALSSSTRPKCICVVDHVPLVVKIEPMYCKYKFPLGLEDVSKYPALILALLERKWTETELADVLRRNFLRVFEEVEKVSDQLSRTLPSEVHIPLEEVQNPCRLVLRPPTFPAQNVKTSSSVQHSSQGPTSLLISAMLVLLSHRMALQ